MRWVAVGIVMVLALAGCTIPEQGGVSEDNGGRPDAGEGTANEQVPPDAGRNPAGGEPQELSHDSARGGLTNRTAAELVVTIQDLDAGWMKTRDRAVDRENTTSAHEYELYRSSCCANLVSMESRVYAEVEAAEVEFRAKYSEAATSYSIGELGLGWESAYWHVGSEQNTWFLILQGNVVWQVFVYSDYEPFSLDPTIKDWGTMLISRY